MTADDMIALINLEFVNHEIDNPLASYCIDCITAQAAEIARLREALEYIMDGYGLSPPNFENLPNEFDDWIVAKIRAALE